MTKDVCVVIPAYNEGPVIRETVQGVLNAGYRVVVVDDCSQDNTTQQLEGLPAYVVRHPVNLGQGAALQTGMTLALRLGAQRLVHFDADGQHDVRDIAGLLSPLERGEADVVLGSRFLRAADQGAVPFQRRLLLRVAVVFNGLVTGLWLSDAHNGLRAFTRDAALRLDLRENRSAHASEILQQIRRHKLRCVEAATNIRYTQYSVRKGQRGWAALEVVMDLVLRRLFP